MNLIHAHTRRTASPLLSRLKRKALPLSLSLLGMAAGSLLPLEDVVAAGPPAGTLPTGGSVYSGTASVSTTGTTLTVSQTSQRLAMNWTSFDIASGASVNFVQPNASAIALNRIGIGSSTPTPSQIFGSLNANGQVFLINPAGIVFGNGSTVNVGGLVASSLDMDQNTLGTGGPATYTLSYASGSGAAGEVINHGTITAATGGGVVLVGGAVLNDGSIVANAGHIFLDGAEQATLDFDGTNLINVTIPLNGGLTHGQATGTAVTNTGTLQSDGGMVVLQASATPGLFTQMVNNSGIIKADNISGTGGTVQLIGAGGAVASSGQISADGASGGTVQISSDQAVSISNSVSTQGGSSGNISLSGNSLTLGAAINAGGGQISLASQSTTTQSTGSLTAGTLAGSSASSTSLTSSTNAINALGSYSSGGDFSFTNNAAITQSAPLSVTGSSTFNAGNNAITLTRPGNAFGSTVNASGTGIAISSSGDLTMGTLADGTNGAVSLTAGGTLTLPSTAIDTGTSDLTLMSGGGMLATAAALSGTNVTLSGSNGVTLDHDVSAAETLALTSGQGSITQIGGALSANTLTGSSLGSTTLNSFSNAIANLGKFGASSFSLADTQALNISDAVNVSGSVALNINGGGISETGNGSLTAGTLTGGSTGSTALTASTNAITNLGSFNASGFSLTNAQALAITGTVSGGSSVTLNVSDASIPGNGSISEGSGGSITAGSLSGSSTGSTTLISGANAIANLGNFSANGFSLANGQALNVTGTVNSGTGAATIGTGSNALTISGTVANGGASNNTVSLTSGNLTVNGAVSGGGGTVALTSSGTITESGGVITAGTLTGSSAGSTSLTSGANAISNLGNFGATGFSLGNGQALNVTGTVNGGTGGASIDTGSNALTISGTVANGGASSNTVSLSSGNLAVNGAVNGGSGKVVLTSSGAITEGGGVITAGTLTGQAHGDVSLNGANQVNMLATFGAPNFRFNNNQALSVNGPLTVPGALALTTTSGLLTLNAPLKATSVALSSASDLVLSQSVTGQSVSLSSGGAISQDVGGVIAAGTLDGSATGSATLGGNNAIGSIGGFSSNGFSLNSNQALTISGVVSSGSGAMSIQSGGNPLTIAGRVSSNGNALMLGGNSLAVNGLVDAGAGTVTLNAPGSISEGAGGVITAAMLTGSTAGAALLDGNNRVGSLGGFTANGFSFTNGQSLEVNGPIHGGSSVALTTTSGDIAVNGGLRGGTTTLNSAGVISEGSGGSVVTTTLTGRSAGSTVLDPGNQVTNLGAFTANGFTLLNGQTLNVSGPVNGGSSVNLVTSAGDIVIGGAVNGATTTLTSAGSISETSGGSVQAGVLTGSSVGDTALGASNAIGTLGAFNAANLSLSNGQALNVAGPVGVSGSVDVTTSAGALTMNAPLNANTVTLQSAGDLDLQQNIAATNGIVLNAGGNISQSGGALSTNTLTGSSGGSTTLDDANAIDTLNGFTANGFSLSNGQGLAVAGALHGGDSVTLGTTTGDLLINAPLYGGTTTLTSAGVITEGNGGIITANTLNGSSGGATTLGNGNLIGTVGSFNANGFSLTNAQSLAVNGALSGGSGVTLNVNGNLAIQGALNGGVTTFGVTGAVTESGKGAITANMLTGNAAYVALGTASNAMANRIAAVGGFGSPGGFSVTNDRTLTLQSYGGRHYTINAGTSAVYFDIRGGDLLQSDTAWMYDGSGTYNSTGHIGTSSNPIYVTAVTAQFVESIGLPPAYFYTVNLQGDLLPVTGISTTGISTQLQIDRALNGRSSDAYIDPSVVAAKYRAYDIVPTGILLPPDQQTCTSDCEGE